MKFTWDERKRLRNRKDHDGVDFEDAKPVFSDPLAIDRIDDRFAYGEERCVMIGRSGDRLLAVVYVEQDDGYRLISARLATKKEIDDYCRDAFHR